MRDRAQKLSGPGGGKRRLGRLVVPLDIDFGQLSGIVAEQPDPLVFATVSGAHLYGFPSRDSDIDLRGAHVLPPAEVVGLREGEQTRGRIWMADGVENDLVSHDVG